jgi:hypothetical protein
VPTELLLFPGEGHELSRSGRPTHRLARLEHVLRWWARWLPTPANPGDSTAEIAASAPEPVGDGQVLARELTEGEPADGEPLTVRATRVD